MTGMRARSTSFSSGGSRSGNSARVYRGTNGRVARVRSLFCRRTDTDLDPRACPSCHLEVPVRKTGELAAHRVGPDRPRSWPCPGDHPAGVL